MPRLGTGALPSLGQGRLPPSVAVIGELPRPYPPHFPFPGRNCVGQTPMPAYTCHHSPGQEDRPPPQHGVDAPCCLGRTSWPRQGFTTPCLGRLPTLPHPNFPIQWNRKHGGETYTPIPIITFSGAGEASPSPSCSSWETRAGQADRKMPVPGAAGVAVAWLEA